MPLLQNKQEERNASLDAKSNDLTSITETQSEFFRSKSKIGNVEDKKYQTKNPRNLPDLDDMLAELDEYFKY